MPEYKRYVQDLPVLPTGIEHEDRIAVVRDDTVYAASSVHFPSGGGGMGPTDPIVVLVSPAFAASGSVIKLGVPTSRLSGSYSVGTVTETYRMRDGVRIAGSSGVQYTPVADDVGKLLQYVEVVTNSATGEVRVVTSVALGPVEDEDVPAGDDLEVFDFTVTTPAGVTVARSTGTGTSRIDVDEVEVHAPNELRIERNDAGVRLGVLCESYAANLVPNARDLGDWLNVDGSGVTVTRNYGAIAAPNGANEATRVQVAANNGFAGISRWVLDSLPGRDCGIWLRTVSGTQTVVVSDPDTGDFDYFTATTVWQKYSGRGTQVIVNNAYGLRVLSQHNQALDVLCWGGYVQVGPSSTMVASNGTHTTRDKEVLTFTLSVGSVTRDIQVLDAEGQVQNFLNQTIGGGATWGLDADDLFLSPVIAKVSVHAAGTLPFTPGPTPAPTPPPAPGPGPTPPPPPPPPTGLGLTIDIDTLIQDMQGASTLPWFGHPPNAFAKIDVPVNAAAIYQMFNTHMGRKVSRLGDAMNSLAPWLWAYGGPSGTPSSIRLQYTTYIIEILLDSPTGQWIRYIAPARVGNSMGYGQLWAGNSPQGGGAGVVGSRMQQVPDPSGGGVSIGSLTGNAGIEAWPEQFYMVEDLSVFQRAYAVAGIVGVRCINASNNQPYSGSSEAFCVSLGNDPYRRPKVDYGGEPDSAFRNVVGSERMDGACCRWKPVTGPNWHPVAFVTMENSRDTQQGRPAAPPFTGSWPFDKPPYVLTEAQLRANPPSFVV